jgi:hypothetical protein
MKRGKKAKFLSQRQQQMFYASMNFPQNENNTAITDSQKYLIKGS